MGIRRFVAGGVVGALVMLVGTVSSARAGNRDEPIFADLTGDGRIDRVTSVRVDDACGISVEEGLDDGGYAQACAHVQGAWRTPPAPLLS